MDLLQLTYFCHAAQTENFSKTAERFFVPPTGVSQTVKRLEQELGTRLFNREPNKVTLNQAGRIFYEKIRRALDLIEEGKQELEAANSANAGKIKILVHTCRRIVTQAVESFKNKFPDVFFIIHHTKDGASGDYDFIVSDRPFSSRLSQKSLLLSENIVLACNRNHALASKRDVSAKDLANEEFIAMSAGNSLHGILTRICEREKLSPKIAIQSDDPFYVKKYLDEGLGLAFVPAISWRGTFSENTILKPFGDYARDTFVFYDEAKFMPNIQKNFLKELKTTFEKETLPTV